MTDGNRSCHQEVGWSASRFRWFGLLLTALISVCAYPVLFVFFHNVREAFFVEVLPPIVIFVAVGLGAWLFFGVISGKMVKGAFTALLFVLAFTNYSLIENIIRRILPEWRWWQIAPSFFFLFINAALALRFFITNPQADSYLLKITVSIGSAFLALTLFNLARGILTLASTSWSKSQTVVIESEPAKYADNLPNFYFLIFDEYARQDVLKKYTGYDNGHFLKGLERKGFSVSYSSCSTSDSTRVSVGNLLCYAVRYETDAETMDGIRRPPLFDAFRKAKYTIYSLSSMYQIDEDLVDVVLKPATVLEALSLEKTVEAGSFIAYLRPNGSESYRADRLGLLRQLYEIIDESSRNPKFIFFHIFFPHEPFIFTEDGDPVSYENMHSWADTRYYTGQLRFLSKEIDELTDIILERDPNAIVLMQSDHGARYFERSSYQEKLACFNCLYLGGTDVRIEGLSTIDTLRLALTYTLALRLDNPRN